MLLIEAPSCLKAMHSHAVPMMRSLQAPHLELSYRLQAPYLAFTNKVFPGD